MHNYKQYRKSQQKATFTHTRITNEQEFEQVVAVKKKGEEKSETGLVSTTTK